ncbi:MAG: RNA methyltransferase [Haliscomenobacter sp.]|uniref:RNA methyltransferase n=1 Tax=Haliscomenobacter sp. TaxID=2717303 RepID=UPI0029A4D140|nr:RNA methyltransferase [Haliscomenobacter sp.]MDX2070734.1 RNA methyltransferase [Haliscomenobacter sp.]
MAFRKKNILELERSSVEEYKIQEKTPLILVLDNVRSALNVGSAFRTADGFALQKIYLCGITAQPPHKEILKTAIGATDSVDWEYVEDPAEAVQKLKADGFEVWAVEQAENSTSLEQFKPLKTSKIAVVFGNEVTGVADEVMDIVDGALEIPQFGTKHSLNISVCVGIVAWDLFVKLKKL